MECLATCICMGPHGWPHMLKQGAVPMAEYNERVRGRGRGRGGRERKRGRERGMEGGRERERGREGGGGGRENINVHPYP